MVNLEYAVDLASSVVNLEYAVDLASSVALIWLGLHYSAWPARVTFFTGLALLVFTVLTPNIRSAVDLWRNRSK